MKDPQNINQLIERGRQAQKKAKDEFSSLTFEKLNWKADEKSWSIGQCLEHLVISDSLYFSTFKKIADETYRMTGWQRSSPFSRLFGNMLLSYTTESPTKKIRTSKIFRPSASKIEMSILERFDKHMDILLEYLQ